MKKLLLVLVSAVFLFGCSSTSDDNKNENLPTNENPDNNPVYNLPQCKDFVVFEGNSFLLLLRSLGYDTNDDTKISCSEANAIINLDLGNNQSIKSLKGIESLRNLETITGTLAWYSNTLNLFNNNKLKEINFNVGSTTGTGSSIPTLVLPNGNSLLKLDCSRTHIRKVENITNQSNLKMIKISGDIKEELDLSNCTSLEEIHLNYNYISAVKLTTHNNLKILKINGYLIGGTRLKTINTLNLPNLEILELFNNTNIESLNLLNNRKLKILNVSNNKIQTLDLKNNLFLEEVRINGNLLAKIDLSFNVNLKKVDVSNNYLYYLNLKNGNNNIINQMNATNNSLKCIQIDGIAPLSWYKDSQAIYSVNCN